MRSPGAMLGMNVSSDPEAAIEDGAPDRRRPAVKSIGVVCEVDPSSGVSSGGGHLLGVAEGGGVGGAASDSSGARVVRERMRTSSPR